MAASTAARQAGANPTTRARLLHQRTEHHRSGGLHGGALREALISEGFTPEEASRAAGLDLAPEHHHHASTERHPGRDDADRDRSRADHPAGTRRPSTTSTPGRRRRSYPRFLTRGSGSTSGVMLALIAYPVALATIKDGPAGAKAWFQAKFLNNTSGPSAGSSTPSKPAGPMIKPPPPRNGNPGSPYHAPNAPRIGRGAF